MSFKSRYEKNKITLLNDSAIIKYNRNLFEKFFDWEEEKLKRQNGLPQLDESSYKTLCTYINKLRNVNNWFKNIPWNLLTEENIKQVYNDLEDGKITNRMGKRFEDRSGYYNKIFKAKPFKLAGLRDKVENALEFFTNKDKKEVRFISEEGFRKLLCFLHKPQHFALFWLAWDIGENISSLLDLRVKHFKRQLNKDTKETEYLVYLPKETLKRSRQTRSEPTIYPETVKYLDALFKYGREVEYRDDKGRIRRKTVLFTDDDFVFTFKYRQALQIFDSVVKRSGVKCEPNSEKPSWKDLRSGMACHLHALGWHVEDINLRLGHSPQSKWFAAYVNYLAINRKKVIKIHFEHNLLEVKEELEESKQREKIINHRLQRQKEELDNFRLELTYLKSGKGMMNVIKNLVRDKNIIQEQLKNFSQKEFDLVLGEK